MCSNGGYSRSISATKESIINMFPGASEKKIDILLNQDTNVVNWSLEEEGGAKI
jgi:hypothetical protein